MTINELEQQLEVIKIEIEKLKKEAKATSEIKPWRAEYKSAYYYVKEIGMIGNHHEEHDEVDNSNFRIGNYYRTRELAEQDVKELALRGRIRQLRDALCEGYQPSLGETSWSVIRCLEDFERFDVGSASTYSSIGEIYFDTREHAQQACDILNAELKSQ